MKNSLIGGGLLLLALYLLFFEREASQLPDEIEYHENGVEKRTASFHENGQKKQELNYNEAGKLDGVQMLWYENGQRQMERDFKDGKVMSYEVWKPNGEKCPVTNVKEGSGVWVMYHDDGKEWKRFTFKDGKPVEQPSSP